jgi:hypothetical protein
MNWHTSFLYLLKYLRNLINFDIAIDMIIKRDNKDWTIKKEGVPLLLKFISWSIKAADSRILVQEPPHLSVGDQVKHPS